MKLIFPALFVILFLVSGTGSAQAGPYEKEIEILTTKVQNRQDVIDLIGKPSKIKKNPQDAFSEELIYRRRRLFTNQGSGVSGSITSKCFAVADSGHRQIANRLASPLCFVSGVPLAAAGTVGGWLLPGESKRLSVFLDAKSMPVYYEARGLDSFERGVLDPEKVALMELMKKDPNEQDRVLAEMMAKQKETIAKTQEAAYAAQQTTQQIKNFVEPPKITEKGAEVAKPTPAPQNVPKTV